MGESDAPFDRWHKRYPKPGRGDRACRCGTKKKPLYPSADHGRGQQWQARYTDPDGKQRRPMFDTWQEARDHLDEVRVQIRNHTWVDPDVGKGTVEVYAEQMLARKRKKKKRKGTVDTYDSHIRNHIIPFAGKRQARSLRRRDTMQFIDYLADKPGLDSNYTVHQVFKTWRILVNYMIDEDVPLPANVVSRIELPDIEETEFCPTPQQVAALATAMRAVEPRYEILIWIAACAGARRGESFGLTRARALGVANRIRIEEQRLHGKVAKLKTKSSYATVPVDAFLSVRIQEHVEVFSGPAPVGPQAERRRRARGYVAPPDEGLLVTNRFGRPVGRATFSKQFIKARKLAGLPEEFKYRSLKAFYTTQLAFSGDHEAKTVQLLSRHSRFEETWNTYARKQAPLAAEGVAVTAFTKAFAPQTAAKIEAALKAAG